MRLPAVIRLGLSATAATALLATAACVEIDGADLARFVDRQEKHFTVDGKAEVVLSTFDGSIEIRPWDKAEVEVIIEKRASDKESADTIEVAVEQNGNHISVDAKGTRKTEWLFDHRSAKLIVSLPATTDVTAKSHDGSIDIEGITGHLDLQSGDGSIRGRRLTGDLRAHSGDGSIRLEDLKGSLNADTGDGRIIVNGAFTSLRAHSGDGSVRITAEPGSETSSGWDIDTGDGSVTLALPDGFNAEIDAHTGDGRVRIQNMDLASSETVERRSVRGHLGSGGGTVRVRTGDGSITLKRTGAGDVRTSS